MFYLIAAIWIVGCLAVCVFKHAKAPHLFITCPCLAAATIVGAIFLFISENNLLAAITLGVGLFVSLMVLLAALAKRMDAAEQSH